MKKISFIASRYKEVKDTSDISDCINHFFGGRYETKLVIYDKFEERPDTYKLVPNVGREAYAWFAYVLETWNDPDDYYAFIHPCSLNERQDKFLKFTNLCKNLSKIVDVDGAFCSVDPSFMMNANPLYRRKEIYYSNTSANIEDVRTQTFGPTPFENLKEWWDVRSGGLKLLPRAPVHGFCASSKENLHQWGNKFWQEIFEDILTGGANSEIAHYLERAMISIAAGREAIQKLSDTLH